MTEEEENVFLTIIGINNWYASYAHSKLEGQYEAFSPINPHSLYSLLSQNESYRVRSRHYNLTVTDFMYEKCYREFLSCLNSNSNGLQLASKLYVTNNYVLQDDFQDIMKILNYDIGTADFNAADDTVKILNSWLEEKTKGIIANLISSDILNNDTRLAVTNGVYFKEKWATPFSLEKTPATFQVNENESIQTQMMSIRGEFFCKFDDDDDMLVKMIELPLACDDFSLVIILPGKEIVVEDISVEYYLNYEGPNMAKEEVEVYLPKFKLEQLLNCRTILSDVDAAEEFGDNMNIFNMIERDQFFKLNQLYEKVCINLDETGIEAASGLGVTLVPTELDGDITSADEVRMSELNVKTVISNRFAKTIFTSRMQNKNESPKEANFFVTIPEAAYVTEIAVEIDGKSYKSIIKEQALAEAIYSAGSITGIEARIIQSPARDSVRIFVPVILEPQSTAVFYLAYEELLQRIHNQYELVLNIYPNQLVDNLNVEVTINESRPLKFVKIPPIRSGKEINPKIEKYLRPVADIETINPSTSIVKFCVDAKYQRKLANYLGTFVSEGFSGQFVVQYDVERDPRDGEVLLQDGYFVHFFAPNDLDPLPKHVVFVLDTGLYMDGRKIRLLRDAVTTILNEIRKEDLISILEFNDNVIIWDLTTEKSKIICSDDFTDFKEPFQTLDKLSLPDGVPGNDLTLSKASSVVNKMLATGESFLIGGLETGLYILKTSQERLIDKSTKYQPILIFMAYGKTSVGINLSSEIVQLVTQLNLQHDKVPIYSVSFGEGANQAFLRELSSKNFGFSKHIYEAADASIQFQSFYKQISSPLLSDVEFKYEPDVTEVTGSHFSTYFSGSELVVCGRCTGSDLSHTVSGCGLNGFMNFNSVIKNPVASLERLWAYLTIKQLLQQRNEDNKEELTKKAIDLALKYSFATEVTSLLIVKSEDVLKLSLLSIEDVHRTNGDDIPPGENFSKITDEYNKIVEDDLKRKPEKGTLLEDISRKIRRRRFFKKRYIEKTTPCEENSECLTDSQEEVVPEEQTKQPKLLEFRADQPFLIALMIKRCETRIILFAGCVRRPSP